jgi:hypothetical protein
MLASEQTLYVSNLYCIGPRALIVTVSRFITFYSLA